MALLSWLFGKKVQKANADNSHERKQQAPSTTGAGLEDTAAVNKPLETAHAASETGVPHELAVSGLSALPVGPFRFIALDVETANDDLGSICQIGLAFVRPDNSITTWSTYVNPRGRFSAVNVGIHGITARKISEVAAPDFEVALSHILPALTSHTVFQHSDFDKRCIARACEVAAIKVPKIKWSDSVRVAQKAWPELKGNGGHGLASLRNYLGLNFRHHDGEEDARASAEVVLRAEAETGKPFDNLAALKARKPIYAAPVTKSGNPEGSLAGQVAVFTGALSMSREEAATIAANHGISVAANVTKKTTILIVGDQDLSVLAGHTKSSKHRKAEDYIANGQPIRIVGESAFLALLSANA